MSEININYKGSSIATMDASGTKTLLTEGKYCEDDIEVVYTRPAAPTPSLQTKSKTYTPTTSQQTESIAADSGYDGLSAVNVTVNAMPSGTAGTPSASKGTVSSHSVNVTPSVTNTTGYITGGTKTGSAVTVSASELVSGTKSISANGTGIDVTNYASVDVAVPTPTPSLQTKTVSYTPSETAQTDTVTADSGYDGLDEVDVSVAAVSSTYVGSGITRRSSTDLTASGATVTAPAGYYASGASKSVASGTAGTPTATKGSVSNHAISVTPSVTNTTGYITGGTKTGTAVSVSASELVSGNLPITANGTGINVANYSTVSVAVAAEPNIGTKSVNASGTGYSSVTYSNLLGEPKMFAVILTTETTISTISANLIISAVYDGTNRYATVYYKKQSKFTHLTDSGFTFTYSSGTLTVSGTSNYRFNKYYRLIYVY